jgi:hypothetical protein
MRFDRNQLRYMALMALDEAAEACRVTPLDRSMWLRFLLAWLYVESGSNPENRWLFDDFWKTVTKPATKVNEKKMIDAFCRSSTAQSCLNGIYRSLGLERTAGFAEEMRLARQGLRRG